MKQIKFDTVFAQAILDCRKRTTIRKEAKAMVGEAFEVVVAGKVIAEAVCTGTAEVLLCRRDHAIPKITLQNKKGSARKIAARDIAQKDGFPNEEMLADYLESLYGPSCSGDMSYYLVEWKYKEKDNSNSSVNELKGELI